MLAQSASLLKQAMPMLAQVATATRHYQAIYDVGKYSSEIQQQLWPCFRKAVIDGCAKAFPRTASFAGLCCSLQRQCMQFMLLERCL
jgi:hypothetical protein